MRPRSAVLASPPHLLCVLTQNAHNFFRITSFADPHPLTPLESNRFKNRGRGEGLPFALSSHTSFAPLFYCPQFAHSLCFDILTNSFVPRKNSTSFFSSNYELFCKNTRVGGTCDLHRPTRPVRGSFLKIINPLPQFPDPPTGLERPGTLPCVPSSQLSTFDQRFRPCRNCRRFPGSPLRPRVTMPTCPAAHSPCAWPSFTFSCLGSRRGKKIQSRKNSRTRPHRSRRARRPTTSARVPFNRPSAFSENAPCSFRTWRPVRDRFVPCKSWSSLRTRALRPLAC